MKLSHTLIHKMIRAKCTKTDFNLIFTIAHYQFDNGLIPNLYYKDIIKELGINTSTYYRSLHRLEERGILTYDISERVYGYHNIKLLDNDYTQLKDIHSNKYLHVGHVFLESEHFYNLKATEKYLLLQLLMRRGDNKKEREIALSDESIASYAQISQKNKPYIKQLVTKMASLKSFGNKLYSVFTKRNRVGTIYTRKTNVHYFTLKHFEKNKYQYSENEKRQKLNFIMYCRKYNIKYTDEDISSLCQMDHEYNKFNYTYKNVVKEILRYYKEVKGAIIRTKMDNLIKIKYNRGDSGTARPVYIPLI